MVGSVSGGCIEDDLIDRVRKNGIALPDAVRMEHAKTAAQTDGSEASCAVGIAR